MLEPQDRRLLLDALRPPEGCRFDCAIGTTYSLDLVSLLMAPLAFTRFDVATSDTSLQVDPMAWLEALRRHAGRIGIYCQAGQIAVPPIDNRLYGYLEQAVVEVAPAARDAVFHPKVWSLRFIDEEQTVHYRLLCMSRNMTFDRSWDTMLVLDGVATSRDRESNASLGQFFGALPGLARSPVPEAVREYTALIEREIRTVEFELPAGFTDMSFWPLGVGTTRQWPFPSEFGRALVVSPFVTEQSLRLLAGSSGRSVLVSRQDELDRIAVGTAGFEAVYTLSQGAEPEEAETAAESGDPASSDSVEIAPSDAAEILTGLHAKFYLFEQANDVRLFTGSANATTAAFNGNVEFLIELVADRRYYGIEAILRAVPGETRLIDLLQPYHAPESPVEPSLAEKLDDLLSDARRQLAAARFDAVVSPSGESFNVEVTLRSEFALELASDTIASCRPVTLSDASAAPLPLSPGESLTFTPVSFDALTTFLAVELTIERDGVRRGTCFAMNLSTTGMPEDRPQRLLRSMLVDRERFLRFLMLLLRDDGLGFALPAGASGSVMASWIAGSTSTTLLESLLQTYDRSPEKLEQIERLVSDLCRTKEGREILPDRFMEIWEPVWEARAHSLGLEGDSDATMPKVYDDLQTGAM